MYEDDRPEYDDGYSDPPPRDPWREAVLEQLQRISTHTVIGLALLALAVLMLLFVLVHVSQTRARGAPAPLPRREARPQYSPFPRTCQMYWRGVTYRATFEPGGRHTCSALDGRQLFEGVWVLHTADVLEIRERYVGNLHQGGAVLASDEVSYQIHLRPGLRQGSFEGREGEVNFRLER